ncbi:MAG TPA: hypothetical protein VKQ34_00725, partial [Candidatus Saccharimonadales bacterium]|nr:hypothetical protein [Candidatus Saccharimonadales bacterium]
NGTIVIVPATKAQVGTGNDTEYSTTTGLAAGDYTLCVDPSSVFDCGNAAPGDYSSSDCGSGNVVQRDDLCPNFKVGNGSLNSYAFGFVQSTSTMNVTVIINLASGGTGTSEQLVSNLPLTLTKTDGTGQQNTTTGGWTPYNGGNTEFSATAAFSNVAPGTYNICVTNTQYCANNVSKPIDAPGSATITLTGAQAAAIAGSIGGADEAPPCEKNGDPLTWALCPIFDGMTHLADFMLNNIIQPLLQNNLVGLNATDSDYKIWSAFRIYGDIFLVIALLVVVIGQSVGGGLLEAYTVRKVLPRILMATILINLSIYIVAFAVDIANIIGAGVGNLLISPVRASAEFTFTPNGIQAAGIAVGAVAAAGLIYAFFTSAMASGIVTQGAIYLFLFVILPALLALLGAFITIILLKALILTLIIVSPVAFALYCLPNTEQYFRKWWEWLFRALLVYPIVMFVFAISDLMTVMIQQGNGLCNQSTASVQRCPALFQITIGAGTNFFAIIVAFFVQFLPLALIPFAFRLAGGIIGKVHDTLAGYGKKAHEGILGNPNDPMSWRNRSKRDLAEAFTRSQHAIIKAGDDVGKNGERAPLRRRARAAVARRLGLNVSERMARYNKAAAEAQDTLTGHGDDTPIYAAAGYSVDQGETYYDRSRINEDASDTANFGSHRFVNDTGHRRYFTSKGKEISAGQYAEGQRNYGATRAGLGQAFRYTLQKAQDDTDLEARRFALDKVVAQKNLSQNDLDAHIQPPADYPNKGPFLDEWYSKGVVRRDASGRSIGVDFDSKSAVSNREQFEQMNNEISKTRQPHLMMGGRDRGFRIMQGWQEHLESQLANDSNYQERDASGGLVVNAAKRQKDLDTLSKIYQNFENAASEIPSYGSSAIPTAEGGAPPVAVAPGVTGERIVASGATSEAKPVIEQARRERRFDLGDRTSDGRRAIHVKGDPARVIGYGQATEATPNPTTDRAYDI